MQKCFKQYTARVENVELETDNAEKKELPDTEDMNVQFSIFFTSNNVDVFEEILIVDEISLIGSLGGSLGLFIGFSFFGYITTLLDIIVDKMFYMSSKWINSKKLKYICFINTQSHIPTLSDLWIKYLAKFETSFYATFQYEPHNI